MRRLCEIETAAGALAATEHVPQESGGVALLLLNFGHVARSGVGDLAARTGDSLSGQGVTTLRVDLPGLGDTPGDIPADEAAFFRGVQRGDHAALAGELARGLRARSGARAVVVGGLCGGGVTAIYAADRAPSDVDGLLLIEPDYSLVPLAGAGTAEDDAGGGELTLRQKLTSTRSWLRLLTGESRYRLPLPHGLRMSLARRLMLRAMPSDANMPLVEASARSAERGLPILCITAEGKVRELYVGRVADLALAGPRVETVSLAGTNHVLSAGGGQGRAIAAIGDWLRRV